MTKARKPIVVSGIQPTGPLHIGNYLGALKNWVDIQNSDQYHCFFFVADYHSLTENYQPAQKKQQIFELVSDFLAAGLEPKKSTIFIQSEVPQCAELAWIFNTLTPVTELERMTQFKDKAKTQKQNVNMGLFAYPVLQAADILIYHGELIPVGQDQIQHVELTRDIARWFNRKYQNNYFPENQPLLTPTPKIMSLIEPTKKMAKSLGEKHWIGINETPEKISAKIAKAVSTPVGITSLKTIYQSFSDYMHTDFDPKNMAQTKKIIAQGIADYFAPFREKKTALNRDQKYLLKTLAAGREKANAIADQTIKEVKKIIGVA